MNPYREVGTNRFAKKPIAPTAIEEHMRKIRAAIEGQRLSLDEEMELIADLRTVLPERRVIGGWSSDQPFTTAGTRNGYLK